MDAPIAIGVRRGRGESEGTLNEPDKVQPAAQEARSKGPAQCANTFGSGTDSRRKLQLIKSMSLGDIDTAPTYQKITEWLRQ